MGITKQYLRYVSSGTFNIISSSDCNCSHVSLQGVSGRYVAVGACEHVFIWDMRLGEKAQVLPGEHIVVSQLAASPTGNHVAVGYVDGNINVYELNNNEVLCVFAGHKSAVSCLQYDDKGLRVVSGSKDTEVIVWDVVAEKGIARLSGHKGGITSVSFINSKNCIVSSSKDSFVKFWDVETKHCFKTLGGHQTEIWSAVLLKEERYLVTGGMDQELKVWNLKWKDDKTDEKPLLSLEIVKIEETEAGDQDSDLQCHQVGTLIRGGRGRVVGLSTDPSQGMLACFGTDSILELFLFCSDEEAHQRMNKRLKKQRKRLQKQKEDGVTDVDVTNPPAVLTLSDQVKRLTSLKLNAKIKSASLLQGTMGEVRIAVTLSRNTLELHSFKIGQENKVVFLKQIIQPGHQKEPRCVAFSSDNMAILSASADSIKIWNRTSQSCLRTMPVTSSKPLSICFVPGDRHALCGCANGQLLVLDINASVTLETIPAHTTECWTVGLTPDQRGCYSGGGDKTVKLWQFELVTDTTGESKAKVLSLLHTRTLELDDTVLAVKISPNSKFIAVALLDSTVKIFFLDTFKFYLSLYGHKLPILCLDISYDSNLIVTGSADRSVKIWGMDFGDCHKSIFAHNDSVTAIQFVPSTHYFFTCSKDGKVKQWDGDSYDNIITLHGHAAESWSLSVGAGGLHVVSCGSDNALRLYTRTDEPVVLGDIDEEEEGLATGERAPIPGLPNLNLPSKKTIGAEKAADSIMECLKIGTEYKEQLDESNGKNIQVPLLMAAYNCTTPEDFLLEIVKKIRSSDLEEALLLLPFKSACDIVAMLPKLLDNSSNVELLCRFSLFLVKIHHASLIANHSLLKHLIQIQAKASMRLNELRDMVGYNVHALLWMQSNIEEAASEQLFREATMERRTREKRRRTRTVAKRPLVVLT